MNRTFSGTGVLLMAGGRGSRMGDLTKNTPKPLLSVGKNRILDYVLGSFLKAGLPPESIHIRCGYLGEMIRCYLNSYPFKISDDNNASIALNVLELLDELPDDFIAGSCDLFPPEIIRRTVRIHQEKKTAATLAVGKVREKSRWQKKWNYRIENGTLKDLSVEENETPWEKASLVFCTDALRNIAPTIKKTVETLENTDYREFNDGWMLILKLLLDAKSAISVIELEESPCFNINQPEHLRTAEMWIDKWKLIPFQELIKRKVYE